MFSELWKTGDPEILLVKFSCDNVLFSLRSDAEHMQGSQYDITASK